MSLVHFFDVENKSMSVSLKRSKNQKWQKNVNLINTKRLKIDMIVDLLEDLEVFLIFWRKNEVGRAILVFICIH